MSIVEPGLQAAPKYGAGRKFRAIRGSAAKLPDRPQPARRMGTLGRKIAAVGLKERDECEPGKAPDRQRAG